MSFDVINADLVAGGEGVPVLPVLLVGLDIQPAVQTLPSQLTGDDSTVLTVAHSAGGVRMFGFVKEFDAAELVCAQTSGTQHLALGQAQWFAVCAVQHRNAAAISVLAIPGTIAAFASVAKPSFDDILSFLGKEAADATVAILGDVRFHRSADTVIDVATDSTRRPWYTDDAKKTGISIKDLADSSTLNAVPGGFVDYALDLTSASGITPGNLLIDGADLPQWAYGGEVAKLEFIGAVAGAGAGADITLKAQIDGTEVVGSDLNLTLANTALPSKVDGTAPSSAAAFKPGEGLDIEVDAVATAFTGGSGTLRVHLNRFE